MNSACKRKIDQINNIRKRTCLYILIFLGTSLLSEVLGQGYEDAPAILREKVKEAVNTIIQAATDPEEPDPDASSEIGGYWDLLVLYTVIDAKSNYGTLTPSIRDIEQIKNINEAARTDKNISASSNATGTTTLVEKAGLPRLIAFAVESGAVDKSVNETNLTLSTTPYALLALLTEDTQQNYVTYSYLNRIGVSATIQLDDSKNVTEQNTKNNLKELIFNVRILGDRSTRSESFNSEWVKKVKPLITKRIEGLSGLLHDFWRKADKKSSFGLRMEALESKIIVNVKEYIDYELLSGEKEEAMKRELVERILLYLKIRIYEPIQNDELVLVDSAEQFVMNKTVKDLIEAQDNLVEAQLLTDKLITELNHTPLLTFGYSLQKFNNRSDISMFKLLYDQPIVGNSLYANAFLSEVNYHEIAENLINESINEKEEAQGK